MTLALALALAALCQDVAPPTERGARVRVFVVDVDGALLVEGWRVTAQRTEPRQAGGIPAAQVDPATGVALFVDLPPGKYSLVGHGPLRVIANPVVRELAAGAEVDVELVYPAPDPTLQLAVVLRGEGPSGKRVGTTEGLVVEAIGPDGVRSALVPRSTGADVWAGIPPGAGPWRVIASSDCHAEVAVDGVRRGQLTDVVLVGNAALEITAVDSTSGAHVESFDVDELDPGLTSAVARTLARATTPARTPGAARFEELVPGWRELVVRAPGFAPRLVQLPTTFAPRTTADVRVELVHELVVRGRVVDTDGTPLAGVPVSATRGPDALPPPQGATGPLRRYGRVLGGGPDQSVVSDADGWFTFEGLWHAEHTFMADFGMGCTAQATAALPLGTALDAGRVRAVTPAGAAVAGARGVSALELRCPPRAEVEVVIDIGPGGSGSHKLFVERADDEAVRRATLETVAGRDSSIQLRADGSLIVKRNGAGIPRRGVPPEHTQSPHLPRGSEVPLVLDADGRLTAKFLVLPGDFALHVATRESGPLLLFAGAPGSEGTAPGGLHAVETRKVGATLGAPSRVPFDLRK